MSFTLAPRGPFSLPASIRFLERFTPAGYRSAEAGPDDVLRLAFPVDAGEWPTVGVALRQQADGTVLGEVQPVTPAGDLDGVVAAQCARLLSLDVDGAGFGEVGERDPVIGGLQHAHPGLRPVCFASPYEAAVWAVISHRIRMAQAATLKSRLAERLGHTVEVAGVPVRAFPGPAALLAADRLDGLPDVKVGRLRAVAEAAAAGQLDAGRLRGMPAADALAELQRLPGIGPFSAELILIRGAAAPDVFPLTERRLLETMGELYRLPAGDTARRVAVAARWAPYRSWASFLVRAHREDTARRVAAGPWRSRSTESGVAGRSIETTDHRETLRRRLTAT